VLVKPFSTFRGGINLAKAGLQNVGGQLFYRTGENQTAGFGLWLDAENRLL